MYQPAITVESLPMQALQLLRLFTHCVTPTVTRQEASYGCDTNFAHFELSVFAHDCVLNTVLEAAEFVIETPIAIQLR